MTAVDQIEHERLPLADLNVFAGNPRHGDVTKIAESLSARGQYRDIVVNRGTHTGRPYEVLAGNHTMLAARSLGWKTISCGIVDVDLNTARAIVAADNRLADLGDYDESALAELLAGIDDLTGTGFTDADLDDLLDESADAEPEGPSLTLVDRFSVPPFTVLDTRRGYWHDRQQEWKSTGITSHEGRAEGLIFSDYVNSYQNWYDVANAARAKHPDITDAEINERYQSKLKPIRGGTGTSVFDPVLAEVLTAWFSPPGGTILDPWAGGSVRGIVAAALGRTYTGCELRQEQVDENTRQWDLIADTLATVDGSALDAPPTWIVGDSRETMPTLPAESADMVLGCPPYYDLEQYGDDPADLSNMSTDEFDAAMVDTLRKADRCLRPDSFAAFVVGAVRDKSGALRDMKRLMITAAEEVGWSLANDAVLVNEIGTGAQRATRQFSGGRAFVRTHQDIVVFVKGTRKAAATRCGEVELAALLEHIDD